MPPTSLLSSWFTDSVVSSGISRRVFEGRLATLSLPSILFKSTAVEVRNGRGEGKDVLQNSVLSFDSG